MTIDSSTASAAITMLELTIRRRLERRTTEAEIEELVERYDAVSSSRSRARTD